ncbi:MAG: hypothetical protein VX453_08005 [Acidobacteriota bacterium]|nr:hypothetical protein [Acidobacteriota bacterium]
MALCLRRRAVSLQQFLVAPALPPVPETAQRYVFPFFPDPVGYLAAVDVRYVSGSWGRPSVTCWLSQRCPLLLGEEPTLLQRTLVSADAGHGIAVPVDPKSYTFVNADLSVDLTRSLRGDWVGLESQSVADISRIGLCQTRLWDADGLDGHGLQSLIIVRR